MWLRFANCAIPRRPRGDRRRAPPPPVTRVFGQTFSRLAVLPGPAARSSCHVGRPTCWPSDARLVALLNECLPLLEETPGLRLASSAGQPTCPRLAVARDRPRPSWPAAAQTVARLRRHVRIHLVDPQADRARTTSTSSTGFESPSTDDRGTSPQRPHREDHRRRGAVRGRRPGQAAEIALELIEAADARPALPPLRAGLAVRTRS